MDIVHLSIAYQFARERIALGWRDVRFGLEHELVDLRLPIEFALEQLNDADDPGPLLIELATADEHDSTRHLVDELANAEEVVSEEELRSRWLYLVLAWFYDRRIEDPDPLQRVEEVYADFGYPEDLAPFVRYMPMDGPDLGSREANERRLFERWKRYIDGAEAVYGRY